MLQVPDDPHNEIANTGYDTADTYDTGHLIFGNGNPDDPDFNSLSDFYINGDEIEIRLPWSLLNFLNPSKMEIHGDYYEHYGIEALAIDEFYAGVGTMGTEETFIPMNAIPLKGWGRNPSYHERLKQGYYDLKDLWKDKK